MKAASWHWQFQRFHIDSGDFLALKLFGLEQKILSFFPELTLARNLWERAFRFRAALGDFSKRDREIDFFSDWNKMQTLENKMVDIEKKDTIDFSV